MFKINALATHTAPLKNNHYRSTLTAKPAQHFSQVPDSPAERILHFQQTVGNQVVQRLIKSGALQAVKRQKSIIPTHKVSRNILQRKLAYNRKVPEPEAQEKGYIARTEKALEAIGKNIKESKSIQEKKTVAEVYNLLLELEKKKKITYWETSGAFAPASYHPQSGEIRLHVLVEHSGRGMETIFIHEATHALHGRKYPKTVKEVGKALDKGEAKGKKGLELLEFMAFTEYWAYRRQWEYYNLKQDPQFRIDPHKEAMDERPVIKSIRMVEKETGKPFNPLKWKPGEKKKFTRR